MSTITRRELRRLWWSCILRDRIIAVGARRPLQIACPLGDFLKDPLQKEDFADEITASEVFDLSTKKVACNLTIVYGRLAVCLTNVVAIIYPQTGLWEPSTFENEIQICRTLDALSGAKEALDLWGRTYLPYLETTSRDIHPAVAAQNATISLCYR